jgi:hypothetical protein
MRQIKATIIKDLTGLFRTYRMLWILLIGLVCALMQPLTIRYMKELLIALQVPGDLITVLPPPSLALGIAGVFTDLADYGLLVILLCFMAFIGGEQKKKSLTIPLAKGLRIESYVISKFILYPIIGFAIGFIFSLIGYGFSVLLYNDTMIFINVISSAALVGLEMMFGIVLCTGIGLVTSQPGIGVAIIYVSRLFLTTILSAAKINRFNPYALNVYASLFEYAILSEVLITILITVLLIVGIFITTYIIMKKRVLKF